MGRIKNWGELERRILNSRTVKNELAVLGTEITTQARFFSPVRTGHLAANWYKSVVKGVNGWHLVVGDHAHYAYYVEYGTSSFEGRNMLTWALNNVGFGNVKPNSVPFSRNRRRD